MSRVHPSALKKTIGNSGATEVICKQNRTFPPTQTAFDARIPPPPPGSWTGTAAHIFELLTSGIHLRRIVSSSGAFKKLRAISTMGSVAHESSASWSRAEGFAHLGVDADDLVALLTAVGEDGFVTGDAVGMVIPQDVPLSGETLVALPAAEVLPVPVLVHGLRVLATENKLETNARRLIRWKLNY